MAIEDRYLAYAAAFEESFEDDDWSRIAPFFTNDVVYATDTEARGNDAVLEKLKTGVDNFDRRMDKRSISFDPPSVEGNTLTVKWKVTYEKAGCPDLHISGIEIAEFDGDRIARLSDAFDPEATKAMEGWMAAHGATLQA